MPLIGSPRQGLQAVRMFCTNLAGQVVTAVRLKTILTCFAQISFIFAFNMIFISLSLNIMNRWLPILGCCQHVRAEVPGWEQSDFFCFCFVLEHYFCLCYYWCWLTLCYYWYNVAGGGWWLLMSLLFLFPGCIQCLFLFLILGYMKYFCPFLYQLPQVGGESNMRRICSPGNS